MLHLWSDAEHTQKKFIFNISHSDFHWFTILPYTLEGLFITQFHWLYILCNFYRSRSWLHNHCNGDAEQCLHTCPFWCYRTMISVNKQDRVKYSLVCLLIYEIWQARYFVRWGGEGRINSEQKTSNCRISKDSKNVIPSTKLKKLKS
jgi:hypothetical protein